MPRSNSSKPTPAAIGISPNIASRFSSIAGSLTFIQQGVRHETFMGYPHETRKSQTFRLRGFSVTRSVTPRSRTMAQRCYTADRAFCSAFVVIATLRIAGGYRSAMRPRSGRWVEAYRLCLLETLRCLPQETWARAHQPRAEHAYERQPRHDRALLTRAGGGARTAAHPGAAQRPTRRHRQIRYCRPHGLRP